MPMQKYSLFERFFLHIDKTPTCWLWKGSKNGSGYGKVNIGGRPDVPAHRAAWLLAYGELPPDSLQVCHKCDTPACVRPSHLFLGTAKENKWDAHVKGRLRHVNKHRTNNPRPVLTEEQVKEIYLRRKAGERGRVLAAEFGVHESTVANIKMGIRFQHITAPLESS